MTLTRMPALFLVCSLSALAMEGEELLKLDPSVQTFTISQENFEYLITALRHCEEQDACLEKLHHAVLASDLELYDFGEADLPTHKISGCSFENVLYEICLYSVICILCEASGILTGLLIVSDTGTNYKMYGSAGSAMLFVAAVLFCFNLPIKHYDDMKNLKVQKQKLLPLSVRKNITKRINKLIINNINFITITENNSNYILKVSSSFVDSFKKLKIFPVVFENT